MLVYQRVNIYPRVPMYKQPAKAKDDLSCSAAAFEAKVSGKDVPKATSEAGEHRRHHV